MSGATPAVGTAAAAASPVKSKRTVGPLVRGYLLVYNLVAAAAWAYVLALIAQHTLLEKKSVDTLYQIIHMPLYFAQSLAILEVVHAFLRFVPSPVFTTALQVASRLLLVWGIYYPVPESRYNMWFLMATLSWSLVEVPRYLFYAIALLRSPAHWMKFIRYSLFLVLYPTGISGEVMSIITALPFVVKRSLFAYSMPNKLNFAFDYSYFLAFILLTYIPGSYIMYNYMLVQRRKQLGAKKETEKKKQ